jgi:hypothetical protein
MGLFGKKESKKGAEVEQLLEQITEATVIKNLTEKKVEKERPIILTPNTVDDSQGLPNLEIGKMKVIIRIRPFSEVEKQIRANSSTTVQANNDRQTLQIYNPDGKITVMGFDKVYDSTINQNILFTESGVCNQILQALAG